VLFSPIWMATHVLTKEEVNESSIFEHTAVSINLMPSRMLCSHAAQKKASHLTALLLLLTASISAPLSLKVRFVFGMTEDIVHICVYANDDLLVSVHIYVQHTIEGIS
jgi:hypothetical protein